MSRLICTLSLVLASATVPAAPVPKLPFDPTKDRQGNLLPAGATARLGSLTFRGPSMHSLAFSPDGKALRAILNSGQMLTWDAETGRPIANKPLTSTKDVQDGLASTIAGDRVVWLSAPRTKGNVREITATICSLAEDREVSRFTFPGRSPRFSRNASVTPDGKYLALVEGGRENTVAVYSLDSGKRLHGQQPEGKREARVYVSPDSKTLYTSAGGPLLRFDLVSGKPLPAVAGTDRSVNLIDASPDGKRLIIGRSSTRKDEKGNEESIPYSDNLEVLDTVANKSVGKLELGAWPLQFGFADPHSLIVLTAKVRLPLPIRYAVSRWNLTTFQRDWEVLAPPMAEACQWLIVSPDGKRFAVSDQSHIAHVHDSATGKRVIEPTGHSTPVAWVGFSSDGERITTIAQDRFIFWARNGEGKSTAELPELSHGDVEPALHGENLVWVTYTEDGKKTELVGWDKEKNRIAWRMPLEDRPERILTHDGKLCLGFAWNKDRRGWNVTVYDGPAGKTRHTWTLDSDFSGGFAWWPPMAVSADGKILFVGWKQGIAGLDIASGKVRLQIDSGPMMPFQPLSPLPMTVSADGNRIAVIGSSEDTHVRRLQVFDVTSRKKLAEHILGPLYNPALRFSPDGKRIAIWDKAVLIYSAEVSEKQPRKFEIDRLAPQCAAFSPNGASLVVGYPDGTSLVWDLAAK